MGRVGLGLALGVMAGQMKVSLLLLAVTLASSMPKPSLRVEASPKLFVPPARVCFRASWKNWDYPACATKVVWHFGDGTKAEYAEDCLGEYWDTSYKKCHDYYAPGDYQVRVEVSLVSGEKREYWANTPLRAVERH